MWTLGPKLAFMDSWACGPKLRVKSGNKPSQFQNLRLFSETCPPFHALSPLLYKQSKPTKETHKKKAINFQSSTTTERKIPKSQKREKKITERSDMSLFDSKAEEEIGEKKGLLIAKKVNTLSLSLSLSHSHFVSFLVNFFIVSTTFFIMVNGYFCYYWFNCHITFVSLFGKFMSNFMYIY